MRKAMVLLSLSLAANAFAVRIGVQPRAALEMIDSPRKAKVLRDARAAFTLADGSQWVTHGVPAQREPGAIGVTRFAPDGSVSVYLVSDWLPQGSIPVGWCGQVYGVTLLDDGRVAASAGWTDGRSSHNAIFVLRAGPDGRYATDKVIEVPGVSQIAGGPRNTILAVTNDANRRGGGPLLTLFDAGGGRHGSFFDNDSPMSPPEAARNAAKAHVQRIGERGVALYDPFVELVRVFELVVGENETVLSPHRNIFIGDDATTADLPVLGIHASGDGDILVVRVGIVRGTPGTHLAIYGQDGLVKQSTTLDRPWNVILRDQGRIRGVVVRDGVGLDSVSLLHEK